MKPFRMDWFVWAGATVLLSGAVALTCFHRPDGTAILAGWAVCLANAGAGALLNRRATGRREWRSFWLWGILGNGVRFLAVFGVLAAGALMAWPGWPEFAAVVVTGYLVFMVCEILNLHGAGVEEKSARRET